MNYIKKLSVVSFFLSNFVFSQSIDEKLATYHAPETDKSHGFIQEVKETNVELIQLKSQLSKLFEQVSYLKAQEADEEEYKRLLGDINDIRKQMATLESDFHLFATSQSKVEEEGYGLWDQEDTTLSQLIMEYGSSDFLYIIPAEVGSIKLNLHSSIPVPRESWSKLIEILLAQNGVGIKQVNPYTRQLYLHKQDLVGVQTVAATPLELEIIAENERIAYIFSPPHEHLKSAFHFFDRFRDPKKTFVYSVGNKIVVVSLKEEIKKLLTLYETVWEKGSEKITKVIPLSRIHAEEVQPILKSFFGTLADGNRFSMSKGGNELSVHTLKGENSIVLIGTKDIVSKAETIVAETELQLEDPSEMTVYWYNCKHNDANDMAEVLEKVYHSLIYCGVDADKGAGQTQSQSSSPPKPLTNEVPAPPFYDDPQIVTPVQPPFVQLGTIESQMKKPSTSNFIPYPQTGSLMMVIRKDTLPKIKDLLRKLDVPKKMVQIEVLLCEKKLNQQTNSGLNVLKLGSAASGQHNTGVIYDASAKSPVKGLFEFFISRKKPNHIIPAYDISYNFLMSQEDIRINAAPSILTVNQTPATISIVEEISINNGAAPIETNSNITFEKSYSREQFGISIVITPTIHDKDEEDRSSSHSVSLETNITFDTPKNDINDRPNVNRRHIQNQVRVLDGQTVVIGGLRKKTAEDTMEKIPFLGEIPGIAKLFGTSKMSDQLTEMYIFITPKIVNDPNIDLTAILKEELLKRPGDLPEYIQRLFDAKKRKKQKLFEQSFKLIFGNMNGA